MKYGLRLIIFAVLASFAAAISVGIVRFWAWETVSTVQKLEGPWEFRTDQGEQGEMTLPNAISLKAGTGEVSLEMTLPKWDGKHMPSILNPWSRRFRYW